MLENNDAFKVTHASFASKGQSEQVDCTDNVKYHFIAFVLSEDGKLIEYDGMRKGPLVVQETSSDVLRDAAKIMLKRVEDGIIGENISVQVLCKRPDDI